MGRIVAFKSIGACRCAFAKRYMPIANEVNVTQSHKILNMVLISLVFIAVARFTGINEASALETLALLDPLLVLVVVACQRVRASMLMSQHAIDGDQVALVASH